MSDLFLTPSRSAKALFFTLNVCVCAAFIVPLLLFWVVDSFSAIVTLSAVEAVVSFGAAFGFVWYGVSLRRSLRPLSVVSAGSVQSRLPLVEERAVPFRQQHRIYAEDDVGLAGSLPTHQWSPRFSGTRSPSMSPSWFDVQRGALGGDRNSALYPITV